MKRLRNENKNHTDLAWEIFNRRWHKQLHFIDWERFKKLSDRFNGKGTYADIGCFNSPMPLWLSDEYKEATIYAVDHCEKLVNYLQAQFPKVHYLCGVADALPFGDESVDYLVAGEIIEHLEDPKKLIDEAYRVLRPGGTIALSTPFEELISQQAVSDEHLWAFTLEDVRELLASRFNNVEVSTHKDTVTTIIGYGKK